jgi:hypothetical protein
MHYLGIEKINKLVLNILDDEPDLAIYIRCGGELSCRCSSASGARR